MATEGEGQHPFPAAPCRKHPGWSTIRSIQPMGSPGSSGGRLTDGPGGLLSGLWMVMTPTCPALSPQTSTSPPGTEAWPQPPGRTLPMATLPLISWQDDRGPVSPLEPTTTAHSTASQSQSPRRPRLPSAQWGWGLRPRTHCPCAPARPPWLTMSTLRGSQATPRGWPRPGLTWGRESGEDMFPPFMTVLGNI